jgi:thiol-disulfide isomerase/thioredoxin
MKNIMLLFIAILLPMVSQAQTPASKNLLGACSIDDLKTPPYSEWFIQNYTDYEPNIKVVRELIDVDVNQSYSVTIFFGTWCSDSKREVPRLLKVLDAVNFPKANVHLVAVGDADPLYRQSPDHEEKGQHLYRVPTFIISKSGDEVGRIVEFPATSLERDLLAIITNNAYTPNYPSYIYLAYWIDHGFLEDPNVSHQGIANQIRRNVQSANELNGFATLLTHRNEGSPEAIAKVLQVNCDLYPEIWWTHTKLAEALSDAGKYEEAIEVLQEGLEHVKDTNDQKRLQDLLDTIISKTE